ncbi:MAG: uroporphyrinogen decarboxylase family protein [Terriglobia bacterium]
MRFQIAGPPSERLQLKIVTLHQAGYSAQGLLRPQQFKAIYKPGLKKIIDCIKANHLPVFLHCCGRVYDYLDDLVEIGIDAYHPIQRTAGMDLATVKKKYGDRICLVGNIDSSRGARQVCGTKSCGYFHLI